MASDMSRPMGPLDTSIEVDVPLRATYDQWTQFEEFPRFMEGVESVTQVDDTHLHWVAEIGGPHEEWDAEITRQLPDERDRVGRPRRTRQRGRVVFHDLGGDRTKVTMMLDYEPEGLVEKIGDALGVVRRRVEGDMERFKEFIEERGRQTGGWRGEIHAGDEPGNWTEV